MRCLIVPVDCRLEISYRSELCAERRERRLRLALVPFGRVDIAHSLLVFAEERVAYPSHLYKPSL